MAEEPGVLRRIMWREIFPGLMLFRCFRLSIGLPILSLATVGALLMPLGPWVIRSLTTGDSIAVVESELRTHRILRNVPPAKQLRPEPDEWLRVTAPPLGVVHCYRSLTEPFLNLFNRNRSWTQMLSAAGIATWYLLIWSLLGAAISRIAVVQLGRRERVSLSQAVRYVLPKYGWYFLAPIFPLFGIALAVIPLFILGLLMNLNFGVFIAGLLWPIALILGLVMAVLLTELLFGWPLMWPTISAEEASDSFQAFSNSFSYTFQRPLQYLGYALLAVLIGGIGGIFVEAFARAVIGLTYWAITFGLGSMDLAQLLNGERLSSWLASSGMRLMELGDRLVLAVADGYYFSFFFCAAAAIYLLLRREVDQTSFDEVYMPDEAGRYSLPPLRMGQHGVPSVDESAPLPPEGDGGE